MNLKTNEIMTRDHYKAIKHMDKQELTAYLQRVYRRGYADGQAAAKAAEAAKQEECK